MTDQTGTESLLEQFRRWLEETRAEIEASNGEGASPEDDAPEVGLYRLAEEFTALRHEVKLQTKGARGLQDQAEALVTALRQALEAFRAVVPREAEVAWETGKPLALALAELDEALDRGRTATSAALERLTEGPEHAFKEALATLFDRQSWVTRRLCRAFYDESQRIAQEYVMEEHRAVFRALLEGYDLIQGRLRRALTAERIERIACVRQPVNPEQMIVVELVTDLDLPSGQVVDEVRRGYTWQGRLLRLAEVRASRGPATIGSSA